MSLTQKVRSPKRTRISVPAAPLVRPTSPLFRQESPADLRQPLDNGVWQSGKFGWGYGGAGSREALPGNAAWLTEAQLAQLAEQVFCLDPLTSRVVTKW